MQMLQDASRSRFHPGLLGLPGTEGRDIRRARDEARKKRQSGSNKVEARVGGTFIHPLIFASPTKYGPTGGGLGGIVGDSNAPSCLASARRQTPYLGRAVGGPRARCRKDFTSWLPPDGRCIRASDFMGASTWDVSYPVASYRTVEARTQMRVIGPVATEWRQRRQPELRHYGTSIQGQDQAYRPPTKPSRWRHCAILWRHHLKAGRQAAWTPRKTQRRAAMACSRGSRPRALLPFIKRGDFGGPRSHHAHAFMRLFTASGNPTRLLQARPLPIPPP